MRLLDDPPMPLLTRPDPARDTYGRYRLTHPDEGYIRSWQRVSTLKSMTADTRTLRDWRTRTILDGLAADPSLVSELDDLALSDRDGRQHADDLAERAFIAGGGRRAATTGTALHAWCEWVETGEGTVADVPDIFGDWVQLYLDTLAAAGIETVTGMIERIVANIDLDVVGTVDRVYRLRDGSAVIGDIKSGAQVLGLGWREIAAQLAAYAAAGHMLVPTPALRVPVRDTWAPMIDVRQDIGLIVHMPIIRSTPTCTLVPIPLDQGRLVLDACLHVRDLRGMRMVDVDPDAAALCRPIEPTPAYPPRPAPPAVPPRFTPAWTPPPLRQVPLDTAPTRTPHYL